MPDYFLLNLSFSGFEMPFLYLVGYVFGSHLFNKNLCMKGVIQGKILVENRLLLL